MNVRADAAGNLPNRASTVGSPVAGATASISRVGTMVQVQVVTDINGNATFTPSQINVASNSFYIVDSPLPIILKSNIFGNTAFPTQTGMASPCQAIGNVVFVGVTPNAGFPPVGTVALPPYTPSKFQTFFVKIWVGHDSHQGFIDRRTQPALNSMEIIGSAPGGAFFQTINTLVSAGRFEIVPLTGGAVFTGFVLGNVDATNTIYLADPDNGNNYLVPFFPQTVLRLPLPTRNSPAGNTAAVGTAGNAVIYLSNPSASNVNFTLAGIFQSNSFGLETSP